ncbi:MAG: DUF190 domain-containing protein [Bradyrhizobiaceae bacterium]|nr:DUF190 domain-containing protein [Bradyrhizobiaceae bacterium]
MDVLQEAVLLRIFTRADDRYGLEEPLYRAIVTRARAMRLAGATVVRGTHGFGPSGRVHTSGLIAADERPVVIEICDTAEKIDAFLPVLDEMMEGGLVTLARARVLQYGRQRLGYFERLKESLRQRLRIYRAPPHSEVASGVGSGRVSEPPRAVE